jgi:3-oxoacyl-[acyl-carrier-protein] synthase II
VLIEKSRIAVTGLGIVCALGNDRDEVWRGIVAGECGLRDTELVDTLWLGNCVAGEVRDLRADQFLDGEELADTARSAHLAIAAASQAIAQSGLDPAADDPYRVGLVLGTCQGSLAEVSRSSRHVLDAVHASCDALAHHLDLNGPRAMVATACSAGANAIGLARDKIWSGDADVMLAGGTDSLTFFSLAGFTVMGSLASKPCAPYSRSDGLSLGEGAGIVVLETFEHAEARGAPVLAELFGYGLSADAYHPSAPDPSGRGATLAMRRALAQAGIAAGDVDYVNGHGTATLANDAMERKAMRTVFGDRAPDVPCSSTKSMIGHTLGAAGAIEFGVCVLASQHDVLPPTANFEEEVETDLDFVPNRSRRKTVGVAVSNSYAFGGNNAAVVVGKPSTRVIRTPGGVDDVVVTGLGAVGALGIGIDAWWQAMEEGRCGLSEITSFDPTPYGSVLGGEVGKLDARGFAPSSTWRKMDALGRQCVVSSRLAWRDAGLDLSSAEMEGVAVLLGTAAGSISEQENFDRGARLGLASANPIIFPNATLNSATGHVCTALGVRGPTSTVTSAGVSSLTALLHGADLIRQGEAEVVLVLGADTLYEGMLAAACQVPGLLTSDRVRPFDEGSSGTAIAASAVTVLLESGTHARNRAARTYCRVLGGAMTGDRGELSEVDDMSDAWGEAMRRAIVRSDLAPIDIGFVAAAAAGVRRTDRTEAQLISKLFGETVAVSAPKSIAGETLGAAGLVGVVASILALERSILAPTVNLGEPFRDVPLNYVRQVENRKVEHCLVNAAAVGGNYVSAVLGR